MATIILRPKFALNAALKGACQKSRARFSEPTGEILMIKIDYFYHQGNSAITGSRDAIKESFNQGLITDGEDWMNMIQSRNKTLHTYNEDVADEIVQQIVAVYETFSEKMSLKAQDI